MNINRGEGKYHSANWESQLPDFVQRKIISDGKRESDALVLSIQSEFGITLQEAVALVTYTRGLDMDITEYGNNKRVLDAGAGFGYLRSVLKKLKINSDVVALDDLDSWGKRSPNISVGGRIQSLPFADESFDTIVASYAIPWRIDSEVNPNFMAEQLKELIRTLKKGGTLKYRPIRMFREYSSDNPLEDPMKSIFENAIDQLKRAHAENPSIKITLVRAYQDDNKSFDEILELTKD